ncbi:MAG: hypothetical protein COZ37_04190 [bacterium (Candidatus Ratteibacteria) CG_4_10_14_3_um_filter_41_18]|uniref:DUF5615 domain-containing protein n=3 Tax=Candidatus Ratteibacteria TaxID=2979319 RepID=A0A2M7YHM1_9BACT|nr:MAG: hypothetical protein COW28_01400 [bacterium (Candidatus Ratteibacteria) CG15_BIG_FIL_POST_REV_8_21_14_020_41_12]PIX77148.1 MAG: hypothetical protein COZ37_04190 [bacterium (Candidatus Ratteibacteria) CG_4_10_14_3_um_filter_41_18]PJA62469.1 MAG: hypothetical protein CO162_00895 [bacterium (Candidatus Ratteibacteria) CG_4_9_14_3_um_filter_41_21]
MKFVVDENVSHAVVEQLRTLGHNVIAISEKRGVGIKDSEIFTLVVREKAIFITRDDHFTNPIRFPSTRTEAIIYIRHGNLQSEEERRLIGKLVESYDLAALKGSLITLYRDGLNIRHPR